MKTYLALVLSTLLTVSVLHAQEEGEQRRRPPRGGGPMHNLTDEQRTCLEGKLGKPGSGERPSHEAMKQAFDDCGIEAPQHPQRRHRGEEENSSNVAS